MPACNWTFSFIALKYRAISYKKNCFQNTMSIAGVVFYLMVFERKLVEITGKVNFVFFFG